MPAPHIDRARAYLRRHGVRATLNEVAFRISRKLLSGGAPSAIHVEISNCCNLRCEYCVLDEGVDGDRVMSEATFVSLLPSLAHARRIDLSGLAEPLMNRRFPWMLGEARRVAPHAHITVCTNATLMTADISEQLVDHGLDELVFSLDGIDPEIVDSVRKGGSLEGVVRNVALLRDSKAKRGSTRPIISATVVLRPDNLAQLPGIVRLAAELGAEAVNVNGLEPYTDSMVDQALWSNAPSAGLADAFTAAEAVADETGLELRLPALAPQPPACPQVFRPIVLADGTVVPCSVLAYRRRTLLGVDASRNAVSRPGVTERKSFGNARERGLNAVWTSAPYREFRRAVTRSHFPAECGGCLLKHGIICPTPPLSAAESLATARFGDPAQ